MKLKEQAKIKHLGEVYYNNYGESCEIIEYHTNRNVVVKYNNGYIKRYDMNQLKDKVFTNPYTKKVFNRGFIGEGKYVAIDKTTYKSTKEHSHWSGMIKRCYSEFELLKYPTYRECEVCEEWFNFQNFAKWYEENNWNDDFNFIDKDILNKGNKIYSPDNCILVNNEINLLFIKSQKARGDLPIGVIWQKNNHNYVARCSIYGKGMKHIGVFNNPIDAFYAYKEFKENHIKQVADEYKSKNPNFPPKLYQAMYNYEVEITD